MHPPLADYDSIRNLIQKKEFQSKFTSIPCAGILLTRSAGTWVLFLEVSGVTSYEDLWLSSVILLCAVLLRAASLILVNTCNSQSLSSLGFSRPLWLLFFSDESALVLPPNPREGCCRSSMDLGRVSFHWPSLRNPRSLVIPVNDTGYFQRLVPHALAFS
jgi:hypothetical protein